MWAVLKEGTSLQPYARAMRTSKKLTASIFLRRQTGKRVVAPVVEKALEEEVVLESLGILSPVPRRSIVIPQGLIVVLPCCAVIHIRPKSLGQAFVHLFDRRI